MCTLPVKSCHIISTLYIVIKGQEQRGNKFHNLRRSTIHTMVVGKTIIFPLQFIVHLSHRLEIFNVMKDMVDV